MVEVIVVEVVVVVVKIVVVVVDVKVLVMDETLVHEQHTGINTNTSKGTAVNTSC